MHKNKIILASTIIILFFITMITLSAAPGLEALAMQKICNVMSHKTYSFCGEKVPIDDPEVFERMDRELSTNAYWQGKTLQTLKLCDKNFPIIEPILRDNGIPDDFKYLAVAESGLRDEVSPANAVGKWQFLKSTAQGYGLIVNEEIDERYNLEKSTQAACKYFNEAFKSFGNWTAVAASYNMGMAGYQNRVNEQIEDNYYNLHLNSETSRYVFRIISYKEIIQNPISYGYLYSAADDYPNIPTQVYMLPLPIRDLALWAKENNTNYKTVRYLNPWIRGNKIVNQKMTEIPILIPKK